jgi:hypothetical protein
MAQMILRAYDHTEDDWVDGYAGNVGISEEDLSGGFPAMPDYTRLKP